jgi:hypothetical protein
MRDDAILCLQACAAVAVLIWGVPAERQIVSWLRSALVMETQFSLSCAPETTLEPTPSHLILVHSLHSVSSKSILILSHLPQGLVFGLFPTHCSHFHETSEEIDFRLIVTGGYKHVQKAFASVCGRNSNIMAVLVAKLAFTETDSSL